MRQLGDPLAGVECLCQHHGAAYAETATPTEPTTKSINYTGIGPGATITQVQITTTERCCIVVNAATISNITTPVTAFEIERPLATIRTTQEDEITTGELRLTHHAAWEVLDPGTYTYYLVNRHATPIFNFGAWIKAVASDCEA